MKKISIITVQNIDISISTEGNVDYICLTDMVKRPYPELDAQSQYA
jgi:hypothetical protein